ncbi:4,5-DOPA dioxygenase extradiol [bacterium]|nr:MAG: 4,5-DOPA dioxygenase extradiol [bacterium]
MESNRLPALFIGHGSPMNAIEDNEYSLGWAAAARDLPRPKAILCVSAHWETRGCFVTAEENPRTIHDFGGFPRALYEMQYPAPGLPEMAARIAQLAPTAGVQPATNWGLDHGTWSVLCRMYKQADIPVVQLSLDRSQPPDFHYQLGRQLNALRDEGVLIIGSGNIVHNLRLVVWEDTAFDWAIEFDAQAKQWMLDDNHEPLIHYEKLGQSAALAINSAEHYLPLLYILGLKQPDDTLSFFNEKLWGGSLSMRCVRIG